MSTLEPETQPQRGTGTGTLVEPTPQVSHGDGDHERFAHYVQKDKIMASALDGTPVVALRAEVPRVPGRDPKKYPVCPMCKEIYGPMGARRRQGQGRPGQVTGPAEDRRPDDHKALGARSGAPEGLRGVRRRSSRRAALHMVRPVVTEWLRPLVDMFM